MPWWRNWYTRTPQKRIPQGLGVRLSPTAHTFLSATISQMSLGVRHVARRRKARLKGFPTRTSVLKNALDVLIYPIAIVGPLALLPQVIKLYTVRAAEGFSLATWLILGLLNLIWLYYGFVHRERPIIITNLMLGGLNFAMVFGVLLFR